MFLSRSFRLMTLILIVGFFINGCAVTPQHGHAQLPEHLTEQGVVVAEIYGFAGEEVNIDDQRYAYLHNRHLVLILKPGKHTFTSVSSTSHYGNTTHTDTLPINREFEVKAGKVTNLGLILFVFDPKDSKKFYNLVLDNTQDVQRYLRTAYPSMSASLHDSDFLLAPGKYLPALKIPEIRKLIAVTKSMQNPEIMEAGTSPLLVAGPAGLVGEYVIKGGKVVDIKIYDTNTLACVANVSRLGDRHFIAMSDGHLFYLEQGHLNPIAPPLGAGPIIRAKLAVGGIVVVDERMTMYWSNDNGKQWHSSTAVQLPSAEATGDIAITNDSDGFFIYTKKKKPVKIIHSDASTIAFTSLPLPDEVEGIEDVVSKKSGTFVQVMNHSLLKNDVLYYKANGAMKWEANEAPGSFCAIFYDDDVGTNLRASCGISSTYYRSTNGGKNWQEIATAE